MIMEIESKTFNNKEQAIIELAFCHYPVEVKVDNQTITFDSFDKAKEYVENI